MSFLDPMYGLCTSEYSDKFINMDIPLWFTGTNST